MTPLSLRIRGFIFTVLVPGSVAVLIPQDLRSGAVPTGAWRLGWLLFAIGAALYLRCLADFVAAGGTPAIYFSRAARWLWGAEPQQVVHNGLYRYSRNPMYLGVLCAIAGQVVAYRSKAIAIYLLCAAVWFHLVVVFLEEPYLARKRGAAYDEYRSRVPRWLRVHLARSERSGN
ncbi:MAG TPA: isoprenylcysteine carboxylmethyltransferase family protein [Terriglobales bacterium]|nr:isoprenylcysteine carboxylmethyltransferase family protein [Terriglobales bacterium]